jgi:hypothetical protein
MSVEASPTSRKSTFERYPNHSENKPHCFATRLLYEYVGAGLRVSRSIVPSSLLLAQTSPSFARTAYAGTANVPKGTDAGPLENTVTGCGA